MSATLALAMQISAQTAGLNAAVRDVEAKLDRIAAAASKSSAAIESSVGMISGIQIGGAVLTGIKGFAASIQGVAATLRGFATETSDIEQSIGRLDAVFKTGGDDMVKWGESLENVGISVNAAISAAGTMGNLLTSFGVGREQAGGLSQSLVELAADMAALNNTSIDQALTAITSGLAGEQEPLKRYGVILTEVMVKNRAFEMGLTDSKTKALDPLARSLAATSELLRQTGNAHGQAAREADTFAGSQKRVEAALQNAKRAFGTGVADVFKQGFQSVEESVPSLKVLGEQWSALFTRFAESEVVGASIKIMIEGFAAAMSGFGYVLELTMPLFDAFGEVLKFMEPVLPAIAAGVAVLTFGTGAYAAAAAIAKAATWAWNAALNALKVANPWILGLTVALAAGAAALTYFAGISNSAASELEKVNEATEKANGGFNKTNETLDAATEAAKRATLSLQAFKGGLDALGDNSQQAVVDGVAKAFKKLAEDLGGIGNVPAQLQAQFEAISNIVIRPPEVDVQAARQQLETLRQAVETDRANYERLAASPSGTSTVMRDGQLVVINARADAAKEALAESQAAYDAFVAQNQGAFSPLAVSADEAVAATLRLQNGIDKVNEVLKLSKKGGELALEFGRSPLEAMADDYASKMKAIDAEIFAAQTALAAARAASNAEDLAAAQKRIDMARKAAEEIGKINIGDALKDLGLGDEANKVAEVAEKIAALRQQAITGGDFAGFNDFLAKAQQNWQAAMSAALRGSGNRVSPIVEAIDIRTSEGASRAQALQFAPITDNGDVDRQQLKALLDIRQALSGQRILEVA